MDKKRILRDPYTYYGFSIIGLTSWVGIMNENWSSYIPIYIYILISIFNPPNTWKEYKKHLYPGICIMFFYAIWAQKYIIACSLPLIGLFFILRDDPFLYYQKKPFRIISRRKHEKILEEDYRQKEIETLRSMILDFNELEQRLMRLRFGLDGDEPLTLAEIGEKLNLSSDMVRELEAKTILKLRKLIDRNN